MHGRFHIGSPHFEFPLTMVSLCKCPPYLGPPWPMLSCYLYVANCLNCATGSFNVSKPAKPFLSQDNIEVINLMSISIDFDIQRNFTSYFQILNEISFLYLLHLYYTTTCCCLWRVTHFCFALPLLNKHIDQCKVT